MPSFFFYSDAGDSAFLARRFVREGHRVRFYIHDPVSRHVYDGLVEKAPSPRPRPGEIVVFDMVKHGTVADRYRREGFTVVGGSAFADRIELNRPEGAKLMQEAGIRIPETKVFTSFGPARAFLKQQQGEWYYKPSGNMPAHFTCNGEVDEMLRLLDFAETTKPDQFELQRKVPGTEISVEGWFDGTRWVAPFNSTVEDKHFCTGGHGPRTGCMANVVWAYPEDRPTLVARTLLRLTPALVRERYIGPIDLNCILRDEDGAPVGLEWSARFGYDALQALSLLVQGDFGEQLAAFAQGRLREWNVRDDRYALTVGTSIPPYPSYQFAKSVVGWPLDPAILTDPTRIFPKDVMLKGKVPVCSGSDGTVATVGDMGPDLTALRVGILKRIKKLKVPDLQWRTDPVSRAESVFSALRRWGYESPSMPLAA